MQVLLNQKETIEAQKMNNTEEPKYAGFWIRVVAALIDSILFLIITFPLLILIYGMGYFSEVQASRVPGFWDFIISYVLPAVAIIVFWIYRSATPGKMMVKVKIVDAKTGEQPSTGQCIGRYFAYFVSSIPLGLGIIWVAFDKRKRGWHDMLAGTVVIRN
jgi:uncharacterized RDD family membrane protein YckC